MNSAIGKSMVASGAVTSCVIPIRRVYPAGATDWDRRAPIPAHEPRLVIYLDNGPKNSGRRTQFLKRVVQFADWSGLEIRLVYYPPYHSKYNPIERCWSALEQKWNGVLLNCLKVVLQCALR